MAHRLDQRGAAIAAEVGHLQKLHGEKFESIQTQFAERDTRTNLAASTTKVAVDAALQAQKEAVAEQNKSSAMAIAKSEAATTKQIDAIGMLISAQTKGVDEKIDDVKTRLTAIEGKSVGVAASWSIAVGIIGMVIAVGSVVVAVVLRNGR